MTTSGRLILPLAEPVLNASGIPVTGATLTVYQSDASTIADLFLDAALTVPAANPQTSDSAGRFYEQGTVLWADADDAYVPVLNLNDGETFTYDNIYLLGAATNISGLAPIDSPAFTGVPTAPNPASNDNSNKIATTSYVQAQGYAPLNSPSLTGDPTTPTAATGTNTTQIASTAFVHDALSATNLAASFAQSLGTSGYITMPGGLIIQWAKVSPGDDSLVTYTLPTPFTTTFYGAQATCISTSAHTGGNGGGAFVNALSLTQIQVGIAWNGDNSGIGDVFFVAYGK